MGWDASILIYIQEHIRSGFLDPIMKLITHTNDSGILFIGLCLILLLVRRSRVVGVISSLSLALEFSVGNLILKNLIARTRPYDAVAGLVNIIENQTDYSFPSGHTGSAFAVTGVFLAVAIFGLPAFNESKGFLRAKPRKGWKAAAIVLTVYSLLLGFSRLYVGVHYPTDVMAGMLLGLICSSLVYLTYCKIMKDRSAKTLQTSAVK